MIVFWLSMVLMVVVALAFLLVPLLRSQSGDDVEVAGAEVNVAVYRERLAELEAEKAEGKITDEKFNAMYLELQRALLEDDSMATESKQEARGQRWSLPLLIVLLFPLGSYALYDQLGASDLLDKEPERAAQTPHDAGGVGEMAVQLKQELETNPEDSQGWYTLGRIYITMGRYQQAAETFDRVTEILGQEHAEILAQKAQALYFQAENQVTPEVASLITKARQDDPNDPGLNGLQGMIAFDGGNYQQAIVYWENMLGNLRPGMSEEGILQAIEVARQNLRETGVEVPESKPAMAGLFGDKPAKVLVELDAAVAEGLDGSHTVFVALKHADGPPMPIAAVRLKVADLPKLVSLDDGAVLRRGEPLAADAQVVLMATVSKSGTAGATAGDLWGESAPVSFSELGVKVNSVSINRVID